jgi:hypothetical protein
VFQPLGADNPAMQFVAGMAHPATRRIHHYQLDSNFAQSRLAISSSLSEKTLYYITQTTQINMAK